MFDSPQELIKEIREFKRASVFATIVVSIGIIVFLSMLVAVVVSSFMVVADKVIIVIILLIAIWVMVWQLRAARRKNGEWVERLERELIEKYLL